MHTYIHKQFYIHACTHTYIHPYIDIRTYIHIYIHAHIHRYITYMHTIIHRYIQAGSHTEDHTHILTVKGIRRGFGHSG